MNRKRKPADNAIEIGNKAEQIQVMGSCIFDLPKSILYIVLLKLPTRSILICKCLCKTWHDLISDHEFAKLHFAQSESYPLVRPSNPTRVSRTLYLVEPEDASDFDFEHSNCMCYDASDFLFNECNGHQFHMNLAKYKIPLRNAEEVLNTHNDANRKPGTKKKLCIKVCPAAHKYEVVNSCNGLLCLSKPFINDPVVVCNPITGEFIHLPEVFKLEYVKGSIDCGFGFSPKTNQYKVIRISEQGTLDPFRAAEVYTLGTGSWECLGFAPFFKNKVEFTTYLKGALYWFCRWLSSPYIDSFDLDTGSFQSVQPPPFELQIEHRVSMGVLGDCLCVCEVAFMYPMNVWVMKDCGEEKSWTKMFSIDPGCHEEWPYGLYQPMKSFENGGFLMFHSSSNAFIYYHPENYRFKYLKLRGFQSNFEAINHVPSFISLKEILKGSNIEVLNINSRCAEYKLLGETRALSLEEEQILSCFPKEVKNEITSEVVSMSYRKQRELEEACRVKKPFC